MSASGSKQVNSQSKSHVDYWKQRVAPRRYKTASGDIKYTNDFYIKFNHERRMLYVCLGTPNKATASHEARDRYLFLRSNGWDAYYAKYKPKSSEKPKKQNVTIGQYLDAVYEHCELKEKTYLEYAKYFRQLVSDIKGINGGKNKHNYYGGGRDVWVAKIDRIRLIHITPDKVIAWRKRYIKQAGASPKKQESAKVTANKVIRNARSLFGQKILPILRKHYDLPEILPFDGIQLLKEQPHDYQSSLSPEFLIAKAEAELERNDLEAYKIFLLSLFAGLRREEIDKLIWEQVILSADEPYIRIETTDYFRPKSMRSIRSIPIDIEFSTKLKGYRAESNSEFVIASTIKVRPDSTWYHYRCVKEVNRLIKWLRKHGLDNSKPLHTLRKEFGSVINQKYGLYSAQKLLGHSTPQLTANHYLKNSAESVGFGSLLKNKEVDLRNGDSLRAI